MCGRDPNTYANTDEVITKHIHLDLEVDFDKQILKGSAVLLLTPVKETLTQLILDTDYLNIKTITYLREPKRELKFELKPRDENFGSALVIDLNGLNAGEHPLEIKIDYETTDKCGAIQFLEPSQTLGKKHPYLFSQCQIYARSMVPCQDTPGVKFTYSASITVPSALTALMSAVSTGNEEVSGGLTKTFKFEQVTAIPSYLIALVVGNLATRAVSERSAVWSEPEMVDAAAYEFADTEEFIKIAEELASNNCLPPSFPYGGMENPCLSFVTPTLLAGDKSAVDVIAHELAHSWTGNLVTNNNWESFWLNEGWTMFLERKIMGKLHGEPMRQFSAIIGWKMLEQSIEFFGSDNKLTALCPKLKDVNPDDAFSSVPYEKGFNFLYYLETLLGGPEVFDPYMKAHIVHFAHQSISTSQWKDYLYAYMLENHGQEKVDLLNSVDWDTWLYAPGMPPVTCDFDTSLSKACNDLAEKWDKARNQTSFTEFDPEEYNSLNANQQVVFLERFSEYAALPEAAIRGLDQQYQITTSRNCEVKLRWQLLCLRSNYEPIFPSVIAFVKEQGRMNSLNQTENGSVLAKETFLANKNFYHPIAAKLIEKDLFGEN